VITTELVIGRHGQATCNTLGIVGGEPGCTGLTDTVVGQLGDMVTTTLPTMQSHTKRPVTSPGCHRLA
jgi:hypothetical protein